MKPTAQRIQRLSGNFFAELENRIGVLRGSGCDVIRLDIGSPDLPPPQAALETLIRSASQPTSHGYQAHTGPPELRQAWSDLYRRLHGVELDPQNEILPLIGSKEGIFHLTQALIDPGDVVLIPDPGYMTYASAALFAGGEPHLLPLLPERGFLPDLAEIPARVLRRAKMLWLNYPNNPTAATADLAFFSGAVDFARRHDLLLCHDAAYSQVTFDGYRAPSILEVPGAKEAAVEFNSLSKSHNMPGWRVGVMFGKAQVVQTLLRLKTQMDSSHFYPVLQAATQALKCDQDWIAARNEIYRQRRDAALRALQEAGSNLPPPQASIYLWRPVPEGWSSLEFVRMVLDETNVSLTPGVVFGKQGERYYRVSLTAPVEQIELAFQRIGELLLSMPRRNR